MKCFCLKCNKETEMINISMVAQCYVIKHDGYCKECGHHYIRIIPKPKDI